jgi:hypothetical protein
MNIRTRFPNSDLHSVLLRYAHIKADMTKRNSTLGQRELWDEVPAIHADARVGDIVKDKSVDTHGFGHVGVVSDFNVVTKRDGRTAIHIYFQFINHTPEAIRSGIKTRKVEFILNNNQ